MIRKIIMRCIAIEKKTDKKCDKDNILFEKQCTVAFNQVQMKSWFGKKELGEKMTIDGIKRAYMLCEKKYRVHWHLTKYKWRVDLKKKRIGCICYWEKTDNWWYKKNIICARKSTDGMG